MPYRVQIVSRYGRKFKFSTSVEHVSDSDRLTTIELFLKSHTQSELKYIQREGGKRGEREGGGGGGGGGETRRGEKRREGEKTHGYLCLNPFSASLCQEGADGIIIEAHADWTGSIFPFYRRGKAKKIGVVELLTGFCRSEEFPD